MVKISNVLVGLSTSPIILPLHLTIYKIFFLRIGFFAGLKFPRNDIIQHTPETVAGTTGRQFIEVLKSLVSMIVNK